MSPLQKLALLLFLPLFADAHPLDSRTSSLLHFKHDGNTTRHDVNATRHLFRPVWNVEDGPWRAPDMIAVPSTEDEMFEERKSTLHNSNNPNDSRVLARAGTLPGSCPSRLFPTESAYYSALTQFCHTYLSDVPSPIIEYEPIVATFDLPASDGTILKWVFRLSLTDSTPGLTQRWTVNTSQCMRGYRDIFETAKAGGLGKSYCVVDGTGGDGLGGQAGIDGMSGQGEVLILGGIVKEIVGTFAFPTNLLFETRLRNGNGS
jgi:hypothetical protein